MSQIRDLLNVYSDGIAVLQSSLLGVDEKHFDAHPVEGKWSIREVVCHLADSEIIYADRIKRVLAEDDPLFFEADPETFRKALWLRERDVQVEIEMMVSVRKHMVPILLSIGESGFQRTGRHSLDGVMTVQTLLRRITNHIPHHVQFIDEKVKLLS